MGLEATATYVDSLVITNPDGGDQRTTADDHLRLIKGAIRRTFPNLTGAVTGTQAALNAALTTVSYFPNIAGTISASQALANAVLNGAIGGTVHHGAVVRRTVSQSINNSTPTLMLWTVDDIDTDTIHDTVSNTERLTVPTGATKVRISAQIAWPAASGAGIRTAEILKNNGSISTCAPLAQELAGTTEAVYLYVETAVLTVVPGDYFSISVTQSSGGALTVTATASWAEMLIVQ